MRKVMVAAAAVVWLLASPAAAQRYTGPDGKLRVALAQQPFSPNGTSPGPRTMAQGSIQQLLAGLGAAVRVQEAALTADENTEYGGWKRLGMALGHFAGLVATNERDGYFTVGLYATCRRCRVSWPGCSIQGRRVSRSGSACGGSGFATIPSPDEGGLALAAVNRMIAGAVRGVKARER